MKRDAILGEKKNSKCEPYIAALYPLFYSECRPPLIELIESILPAIPVNIPSHSFLSWYTTLEKHPIEFPSGVNRSFFFFPSPFQNIITILFLIRNTRDMPKLIHREGLIEKGRSMDECLLFFCMLIPSYCHSDNTIWGVLDFVLKIKWHRS